MERMLVMYGGGAAIDRPLLHLLLMYESSYSLTYQGAELQEEHRHAVGGMSVVGGMSPGGGGQCG